MNSTHHSSGISFFTNLSRFFRSNASGFTRQYERSTCTLIALMELTDIEAEFDGVIIEVSKGGCSFRPVSLYILERHNDPVLIKTEYFVCKGIIRATRDGSYGIQFLSPLKDDIVANIVENHGDSIEDSFIAKSKI